VRSLLGSFLFSGEDIDKKVKVLSGGEKARLALCKLLLHPYNLLILDEPTNHLDMRSKDVLKEALRGYDGTLIVVSHDRDFLSDLTQMVYEVTPTGLKQHIGDIKAFLEARRSRSIAAYEADVEKKVEDVVKKENTHHLSYAERKDQGKRKRKLKNLVTKRETEIEETEVEIAKLDEQILGLDYSDKDKTEAVLGTYQQRKKHLERLVEEWEKADAELTELLAQEED